MSSPRSSTLKLAAELQREAHRYWAGAALVRTRMRWRIGAELTSIDDMLSDYRLLADCARAKYQQARELMSAPECSICRSRHGLEVTHACE